MAGIQLKIDNTSLKKCVCKIDVNVRLDAIEFCLISENTPTSFFFDTEQPFFDKFLNQYHNQQGFILICYFTSARFLGGVKTDWKKRTLPYNSFRTTRTVDSYYYTANIFQHSNHFFEYRASTKTPNRIKKKFSMKQFYFKTGCSQYIFSTIPKLIFKD